MTTVPGARHQDGGSRSRWLRCAALASELYRLVRRPRGRELDLAIAASAILHDAVLWTLIRRDLAGISRLRLL